MYNVESRRRSVESRFSGAQRGCKRLFCYLWSMKNTFAVLKCRLPIVAYWIVAVLLIAVAMMSFGYDFDRALFLATSLLPGMFCAKLFLPEALRAPRRRGVVVGALCCGILVVEWGALLAASRCTQQSWFEDPVFPALFSNPAFLLILLAAVVGPEYALARYVASHMPQPDRISFVSERRKVTLLLADILCIESNDSEVTLHAVDGTRYRTRTRISQWERLLDERFVRIHRAWLVNAGHVTDVAAGTVTVGDRTLEVSRKYREAVAARLAQRA